MQFHFETTDEALLQEMVDAARRAAAISREKGLRPPTVWVSHDEKPRRLMVEFTGADQWEANAQQQEGKDDPDVAAILGPVFNRRLTGVEVYEEIDF